LLDWLDELACEKIRGLRTPDFLFRKHRPSPNKSCLTFSQRSPSIVGSTVRYRKTSSKTRVYSYLRENAAALKVKQARNPYTELLRTFGSKYSPLFSKSKKTGIYTV